ncbi:MAG TPA: alpha/beta hydrolase [Candidatus Desulfobacillus sp.]|nr:alpha/beta hydrolase [Candidatus Desulfobacillus sp.]
MELTVKDTKAYAYTGGRPCDPALPAVVFIHGAANDHSVWNLQTRWFAHHGFCVLAPDLPGHGRSAGPLLATVEAQADWLLALLDAAGVAQAALVGHSMGSLIALEAAARLPQRVTKIALVGTAVPMPVSDALLAAARDDRARAEGMVNLWSHGPRGALGGNRQPGHWLMGAGLRLMQRAAPGVLFNDLSACNDYQRGAEAATALRCPALLVVGSRDLMTSPRGAAKLAASMADARTAVIEGCGHALMAEYPDAVLDALRGFMGS